MRLMDGRRAGKLLVLTAGLAGGCTLAPRQFFDADDPAPLVRARALSLGDQLPDRLVIPKLLDRLEDPAPCAGAALRER